MSQPKSVNNMLQRIASRGYKPILKDWHYLGQGGKNEPA